MGGGWLEKVCTPRRGGQPNSMRAYKGGGGVKKAKNRAYVLYGSTQTRFLLATNEVKQECLNTKGEESGSASGSMSSLLSGESQNPHVAGIF